MAVYLSGTYVGSELRNVKSRDGKEEPRVVIGVASGLDYYHVYMKGEVKLSDLADFSIGNDITVCVRPYVGRNGSLGFSDGTLE